MHCIHRYAAAILLAGLGLIASAGLVTEVRAAELVTFQGNVVPGTIIVQTAERRLYLVLGQGYALRYVVGVGRDGRQWSGTSYIDGKFLRPHWAPPAEMRATQPDLPEVILSGSPANPMGAAALTLSGGSYAIHGTNRPELVGEFVSAGCIRMHDEDILDLYDRVTIGTQVVVVP